MRDYVGQKGFASAVINIKRAFQYVITIVVMIFKDQLGYN